MLTLYHWFLASAIRTIALVSLIPAIGPQSPYSSALGAFIRRLSYAFLRRRIPQCAVPGRIVCLTTNERRCPTDFRRRFSSQLSPTMTMMRLAPSLSYWFVYSFGSSEESSSTISTHFRERQSLPPSLFPALTPDHDLVVESNEAELAAGEFVVDDSGGENNTPIL